MPTEIAEPTPLTKDQLNIYAMQLRKVVGHINDYCVERTHLHSAMAQIGEGQKAYLEINPHLKYTPSGYNTAMDAIQALLTLNFARRDNLLREHERILELMMVR